MCNVGLKLMWDCQHIHHFGLSTEFGSRTKVEGKLSLRLQHARLSEAWRLFQRARQQKPLLEIHHKMSPLYLVRRFHMIGMCCWRTIHLSKASPFDSLLSLMPQEQALRVLQIGEQQVFAQSFELGFRLENAHSVLSEVVRPLLSHSSWILFGLTGHIALSQKQCRSLCSCAFS
jgi:hypothetical protein